MRFTMTIDRSSTYEIARQIVMQIKQAIVYGQLRSGERLPTQAALADELGVGKDTVSNAYESLKAFGLIETRTVSGTSVVEQLPRALFVEYATTALEPVLRELKGLQLSNDEVMTSVEALVGKYFVIRGRDRRDGTAVKGATPERRGGGGGRRKVSKAK